jgi:hypothetical protein
MKLLRRRRRDLGEIRADNIMWGVPRREGYSDTDDPLVHEGLVQHAFLMGEDDQALCGIRPPRRLSRADRTPRAQLALAGPANPRCEKCEAVLAAGTISSPSTFVAQARPEQAAAAGGAATSQAEAAGSAAARTPEPAPADAEVVVEAEPAHEPADGESAGDTADSEPVEGGDDADGKPAGDTVDAEPVEGGDDAEQTDLLVPSHPSTRVRRGGMVTIPAGRQSVLVKLPASAHGAAIAAEIDGGTGQIRVQAVALGDDGTLHITLNEPTTEPIDVMWFVV